MTEIYLPVISNDESHLYRIEIESQSGTLSNLLVCGKAKGQEFTGIDNLIEKIESRFGKNLGLTLNLVNLTTGEYLCAGNLSSSTQSITLGLIVAIERHVNDRKFSRNDLSYVITGDYDKDTGKLVEVDEIDRKVKAMETSSLKEDECLFLYVNSSASVDPAVLSLDFDKTSRLENVFAELFVPNFDASQNDILENIISFDRSVTFVQNLQFKQAKKDSLKNTWKGYFICGQGETGKTQFAYNLCTWLMGAEAIYAPIWITLDSWSGLKSLMRSDKSDQYCGLVKRIARFFIPGWKESDGLDAIHEYLDQKKYLLVIDNIELNNSEKLVSILRETFQVFSHAFPLLLTSRYDSYNNSFEKVFSVKKIDAGTFSKKEYAQIIGNNNPEFWNQITEEQKNIFLDALEENKSMNPGLVSFLSKNINAEDFDKKVESLRSGKASFIEYFHNLISDSFLLLTEDQKVLLFRIVSQIYKNSFSEGDYADEKSWGCKIRGLIESCNDVKELNQNIEALEKLDFIYVINNEVCYMKSTFYQALVLGDFDFDDKDSFIDINNKLDTAIVSNCDIKIIDQLLFELRKSDCGSLNRLYKLIKFSIENNVELNVVERLLAEVEFYGGNKSSVINMNSEDDETLMRVSMGWSNSIDVLLLLFKNGGNPEVVDRYGNSLLHNNSLIPLYEEKCDLLLKQGLDVNVKNLTGSFPVFEIVEGGSVEQLEYLIKRKADVGTVNCYGVTPLHIAVQAEEISKIKILLDAGADLNAKDNYGYAPIHYALHDFDVFKYLVDLGCDVNILNGDEETLLDLVDLGPYIEWNPIVVVNSDKYANNGPLFYSIFKNEEKIHDYLINHGVKRSVFFNKIDHEWYEGRKRLFDLIMGEEEIFRKVMIWSRDKVEPLLESDDVLFKKDSDGWNLLHCAVMNSDVSVARLLLDKGIGVNTRTQKGATPALIAAKFALDTAVLDLLKEYGADFSAVDYFEKNIMHYVAESVSQDVIDYVISLDLDFNHRDQEGFLPLGRAVLNNPFPLVPLIMGRGVSMEYLEKIYFDGENSLTDGELAFCNNPYSSTVSRYWELCDDTSEYRRFIQVISQENIDYIVDEKMREFAEDSLEDKRKKELLDVRLKYSVLNNNPKLAVLWARQGGDLHQMFNDELTVLESLKERDDWDYIEHHLLKHKLI